ncbi:MAG: MATE family efflux transporter [Oscillospiraceae bacterium]|nr:MATE family efflux transporter [Oscillospiraceae bacterium]
MIKKKAASVTNMTKGSILRHITLFSLPLLAGNLFQQLYNTVDTWVVGNYVGSAAFSAVGTVTPIINTLIGVFSGLSAGAGVVISQRFGGGNMDGVRKAAHTAMAATLILGAVFTAVGMLMVPFMLRLIKMPADVLPQGTVYLRIYFAGVAGQLLYNMGAGILRAVGNSRQPFYFLVICALMNIALDLLFVIGFHMGVAGVAWATILSQAVSAVLVIIVLLRTDSCVRLEPAQLRIHGITLRAMVAMGLPTALQMGITSFSNIFVQAYINHFGSACMGGWTAYVKIEQFVLLPGQSVSLALMTFVGQNIGAGQWKRAKQGVHRSILLLVLIDIAAILLIWFSAPALVHFFIQEEAVLGYGVLFLRWVIPCTIFFCLCQPYSAALRGSGRPIAAMLISLFSYVAFRHIYLYIMSTFIANEPLPVVMGYPLGWVMASLLYLLVYYHPPKLPEQR